MNKSSFELYQYMAPAILTPFSFWLFWTHFAGDMRLTLFAWLLPILYAYIVPGVGTNILKVWEFDTKIRVGKFRPHHGFVFGSATASLAWLCHISIETLGDVFKLAFIYASVLGFWNYIYDVKAIQSGLLKVYNQPWADEKGAEAIAFDYAPWFFAGFGLIYGLGLGMAEWMLAKNLINDGLFGFYFMVILLLAIAFPVWGYRRRSYKLYGHSGCRPIQRESSDSRN